MKTKHSLVQYARPQMMRSTTAAVGEGGSQRMRQVGDRTMAMGEEGGSAGTTKMVGEESGSVPQRPSAHTALTSGPQRHDDATNPLTSGPGEERLTTTAVGEEGSLGPDQAPRLRSPEGWQGLTRELSQGLRVTPSQPVDGFDAAPARRGPALQ